MARKSISIDLDAYERLRIAKRPGESFSAAIRRIVPPAIDLDRWFREMDANPPSRSAGMAVEARVRRRRARAR